MTAGDNLSHPQFYPHHNETEMVPVETLSKMRISDRANEREGLVYTGPDRIRELTSSIAKEGIREPLIVQYSQHHRTAQLVEGHHRLEAARNLGLESVPVRVERVVGKHTGEQWSKERGPQPVSGFEPDRTGYVPGDLKPSDIGLPGKKP